MREVVAKIGARLNRRMMARLATVLLAACALQACSGGKASDPANSDWAFLGNSPEMQHHAGLSTINSGNIDKLDLAWSVEMPGVDGLVGNPLIEDGVIFQGGPSGSIYANDVKSGKLLWSYEDTADFSKTSLSGYWGRRMNRGVALSDGKVIITTGDCRMVAVDQKSGKKIWEAQSCDSTQMYGISAAPRVGAGLVFIGNACMDSGTTRGFVDALDVKTGKRRWRFYTVPGDPAKKQDSPLYDMAAKTWGTGWYAKSHGCGSPWDAMTYDPVLNQLYIGVGGPSPFDPTKRAPDAGDELFTNSIIAVDASTGAYKWHFKETPNDGWNYDASVGIMVADVPVKGEKRRTVISVPKSGFAYVLDAKTGTFLSGGAYTQTNWAKGLDAKGRPILDPEGQYWKRPGQSNIVIPSPAGSHGWEALAFDPENHLLYIPNMVMPTKIETDPAALVGGLLMDFYYGSSGDPKWKAYGEIVAWDTVANAVKWRARTELPINGGILHTSGGLVFQGMADGRLVALDAKSGKELWSRQTGGAIRAAPSTVMVDGQQYVIVPTGNGAAAATGSYFSKYDSTPQSRTPPRLLAFRIGGTAKYPPLAKVEPVGRPSAARQDAKLAAKGKVVFESYGCVDCHGMNADAVGGRIPSLIRVPPADLAYLKLVVQGGAMSKNGGGMPQFKDLTDEEASGLFAYLVNEAWDAHEKKGAFKP
jgi:PQQ-dependent dehydrogenase (methanol/ethanol family)